MKKSTQMMAENSRRARTLEGSVQTDVVEGPVGVLAKGRYGAKANHNDEGEHDRIFNCRRTVFVFQKSVRGIAPATHTMSPFWIPAPLEQFQKLVFKSRGGS
jgi:hypothetical protein